MRPPTGGGSSPSSRSSARWSYAGYFLIVADFIRWARGNGVPVGPRARLGRGLAGRVLARRITDIDPLRYDLLFERFLNPERVSMPDFDVDFCMEGRDRVIDDYVAEKYGRERVSQIITYGTMAAKAVVRDVGRVLECIPTATWTASPSSCPFELDITLEGRARQGAGAQAPLRPRGRGGPQPARPRTSLEGLTRNAGKHAGGVVIAPSVLTDFAPLYCEEGGDGVVAQFDKDDVEGGRLVEFDFLGLRTLTVIDRAVATIDMTPRRGRGAAARRRRAADGRRRDLRAAQVLPDHRGVPARVARGET
ncbi:MAG: hypothetical protein U1F11_07370 [Steroidobacteraceae bacterium]